LDYKFILPKDVNTGFVGLEVCATG